MRRLLGRIGWASIATFFSAAVMTAGLSFTATPTQAAYELPAGEMITNSPAIPRAMPQKEAYELYDPKIGGNFDVKNFWMRADVRVRPEMRNNVCFGRAMAGGPGVPGATGTIAAGSGNGACNTFTGQTTPNGVVGKANDAFVQQWVRLGLGYDLSPDVNFYMEIIDSATWGGNGNAANAGNGWRSTEPQRWDGWWRRQQWTVGRPCCLHVDPEPCRCPRPQHQGRSAICDLRQPFDVRPL